MLHDVNPIESVRKLFALFISPYKTLWDLGYVYWMKCGPHSHVPLVDIGLFCNLSMHGIIWWLWLFMKLDYPCVYMVLR